MDSGMMDSITIRQVEINAEREWRTIISAEGFENIETRARYRIELASLELIAVLRGAMQPPIATKQTRVPATWWDHLLDTVAERFPKLRPYLRIRYRTVVTTVETIRVCPHHKLPAHAHIGWLGGFTE